MSYILFVFFHTFLGYAANLQCSSIITDEPSQNLADSLQKGGYINTKHLTIAIQMLADLGVQFQFKDPGLPTDTPFERIVRPQIESYLDQRQQFIASLTTITLPLNADDLGSLEIREVSLWLQRTLLIFQHQQEGAIFSEYSLVFLSPVSLTGFLPDSKPKDRTLDWFATAFRYMGIKNVMFIPNENQLASMNFPLQTQYLVSNRKDRFILRSYYFEEPKNWYNIPYILDHLLNTPTHEGAPQSQRYLN